MDGLPIALAALGHRCMVISPRYDQYAEAWDTGYWGHVNMGGKQLGQKSADTSLVVVLLLVVVGGCC